MEICVIGVGHVGLVTGACLAEIGHRVIGVDEDKAKITTLQAGGMPFYEPHLEPLVRQQRAAGRLHFSTDVAEGISGANIIFICVGTPALPNGEADLAAVERVARRIAETATTDKLVVEKSTVPVQTGRWIERTLAVYNGGLAKCDVASNPEFLREGSAVQDFLHPDRIVVGVGNARAEELLRALYAPIVDGDFRC
ncbi:MAG: nucleotide sugar dehydrogenase, partial [candidate division NC10 bacterium]|nr:nucleotide sugar dehydrogenase [candidate division NC10 bacterium]